ncbi:uracil-xanthine permease family protein [Haloquadratum walsbyi]|uniref:Xanthine/uracil permease family transport protein n=1 Tax=Haloquadratum walsbyi (strain DSM 16854 / JCM 12705 / C23) TaxID=768065 RepID=G0LHC4_HALWC|nr:nucleobase:cation symporter-2 family protein [Haloquadratum walsbyi]CCC40158.1 xanthine/uracil permease family transport protein [Haloquadratum walsbyi C23]
MSDGNTAQDSIKNEDLVEYGIEDTPEFSKALPLGVQHLLAMFLSTVALPLVIASAIGLGNSDTTYIVQMALLVAGVATLVQVYQIGPIGARLPIVMGTSAIFVSPLISVGTEFGLAAIFGAVIIAAPIEVLIGYVFDDIERLFPPLVTGIVVMLVGLTLIPIALQYSAGTPGTDTFGSLRNLGLAALVFAVALGVNQLFDGFMRSAAVLVAVIIGYLAAIPLGLLDLSAVGSAAWFSFPRPLAYGLSFEPSAILIIGFAYIITSMETIGDISGTTESVGRQPRTEETQGGLVADGVMSAVAGVFNAFPNTSFSQNVGLISFTGVASRSVVGIAGVFLIVLGLVPKVAAVVSAMPNPVLGGAGVVLFGMIISIGLRMIAQGATLTQRNLTIIAVSLVIGVGVEWRSDALAQLPSEAQVLATSGLIMGGVTALVLNAVLPENGDSGTPSVMGDPIAEDDD